LPAAWCLPSVGEDLCGRAGLAIEKLPPADSGSLYLKTCINHFQTAASYALLGAANSVRLADSKGFVETRANKIGIMSMVVAV
jgi:hypothetical protein